MLNQTQVYYKGDYQIMSEAGRFHAREITGLGSLTLVSQVPGRALNAHVHTQHQWKLNKGNDLSSALHMILNLLMDV